MSIEKQKTPGQVYGGMFGIKIKKEQRPSLD